MPNPDAQFNGPAVSGEIQRSSTDLRGERRLPGAKSLIHGNGLGCGLVHDD